MKVSLSGIGLILVSAGAALALASFFMPIEMPIQTDYHADSIGGLWANNGDQNSATLSLQRQMMIFQAGLALTVVGTLLFSTGKLKG